MSQVSSFGTVQQVQLSAGTIRYYDVGSGPVLVFVHGLLVNSALWRHVIPELSTHFRCIAPDLPLGGHAIAMPAEADLSPPGVARMVAELLAALGLEDVTLVGNDSGGAICQLVVANHRERIARLVLTNCDAFEQFPPLLVSPFVLGPRLLGQAFINGLAGLMHMRPIQRILMALLSRRRFADGELDAYFGPLLRQQAIRNDLHHFLAAVSKQDLLAAARSFASFNRPVLLVWGSDDIIFRPKLARRLQQAFPQARLTFVKQSRAFVPEDQPQEFVRQLVSWAAESPVSHHGNDDRATSRFVGERTVPA